MAPSSPAEWRDLLEDGSPFELYPEQRRMLQDYFSGAEETLILIPKKNGKTTLLAALGFAARRAARAA